MITNEFKKAYKNLNPAQKLAVDEIEGPVMVIAGPGTGKTQVLTLRIANILLKTQVNPENILALTFSESASFEMRERLSGIIGTPAFRVEISTFHSFTNNIIKNYPDEFPKLLSSESLTEIEQIEIIETLIGSLDLKYLRPFGEPLYYIKQILAAINDLKKEGISEEKFLTAIKKQKKDFKNIDDLDHEKGVYKGEMKGKYQELEKEIKKIEEFLIVFESYQNVLQKEKKYDFNDMLLEVIKVLESNKSLLLRIQEKYQYILIDEHQDTNAAQNKLVEFLASFYDVPNLFVVGDEKQAIYRFQGASLENFLYFKKLYPKAKLINLQKNYRSHQTILDATGSLIEKNISSNILPQKKLLAGRVFKNEKIQVAELSDYNLEYEYVASNIERKISKGVNPSEIAVLSRRNIDLIPLAHSLDRVGIKFIITADSDILTDLQIQKVLILLEAINNPYDESLFIKVMHIDFLNIDPFDIYRLINFVKKEGKNIFKLIEEKKLINKLDLQNHKLITGFYSKYKGWVSLNDNIPFDDLFVKVINESGFKKYFLQTQQRYQTLNKLTGLFDEIKLRLKKNPQFNLADFLNLLQTVKKHQVSLRAKVENTWEDGVRLLTVHKSKGLEFEHVFIINCFDGRWGNSKRRGGKIKIPWDYLGQEIKTVAKFEEIEDERRLFYVGMTRAKREVILTYSKLGLEGKEQLPSQFLQEINQKFLEKIETSDFNKKFNKIVLFDLPKLTKIDPKNKKYLQRLFLEKGLSVTGLENFLECPWKYFFRNLVVLPDVKNKYMIFGTVVHSALSSFIKTRNFKKIDELFLVDKFKEFLEKEAITEKDKIELLEKGEKALKPFYSQIIPTWQQNLQSEMSIRGVKFEDGIILNGKIDMIEILSNEGAVRVHDFKTGKQKTRSQIDGSNEKSKYNYLRQLIFYKILLDMYREGLFRMREGVIDFIEPDDKGRFRSEIFTIKEKDVQDLEKIIKSVANQIINLEFWDQECGVNNCEYCTLRAMTFSS